MNTTENPFLVVDRKVAEKHDEFYYKFGERPKFLYLGIYDDADLFRSEFVSFYTPDLTGQKKKIHRDMEVLVIQEPRHVGVGI